MLIGVPKEIKQREYRVGMTPAAAREAVAHGHRVLVETGAGAAIDLPDELYRAAGAEIAPDAASVYATADMVVKVKEPLASEYPLLRAGQVLFTYLHLAADPRQAEALIASNTVAIAYETVTDARGGLPLLAPMSEVAGRMAIQAGARALEIEVGGRGVLLGGVPGVAPAKVAIVGGGVVGSNAARMAVGLGAIVTVLDKSLPRLAQLDTELGGRVTTLYATREAIEASRARGRSGHRRGAGAGRGGAEAGRPRDAEAHETRRGAGRRRHRPGRLFRDLATDDARRADLYRGRGGALLRRQHARRRGAYLDLRARQRHPALRAGAGRAWLAPRAAQGQASPRRAQYRRPARSRIKRSPRLSAANSPTRKRR